MAELRSGSGAAEVEVFTGGLVSTNAYLVRLAGEDVLVDAPAGVAGWVDALGARPRALLLTHQHFDHVEGVAELVRSTGCRVFAWAPYSEELNLSRLFATATGLGLDVEPFGVDSVLQGRTRLGSSDGAGADWDLLYLPGHSPDSVAYFLPSEGWLFGGDVLMAGGVGRSDFPGGDGARLVGGIREKVFPLGDDVVVFPGHGPLTTVGDERVSNPFL
jgi:glyoxylase-like metal-dependent hydrolase (beta-lactamase superfamily II)